MHYYKKNIGDYFKKAGRLSILQHGVYNLLIDSCYDREKFPSEEDAIDWVWASTNEEIEAVRFVLRKFFELREDGRYYQGRIEEEILDYQDYCETQRTKGKLGGRPKKKPIETQKVKSKSQNKPSGFSNKADSKPSESQKKPKPLTTNHEPKDNILIEFESIWKSKPARLGGNPKNRAIKSYRSRRKEHSHEIIKQGVVRYSKFCELEGKLNSPFVMQLATFLGPDEHFLESWNIGDAHESNFRNGKSTFDDNLERLRNQAKGGIHENGRTIDGEILADDG